MASCNPPGVLAGTGTPPADPNAGANAGTLTDVCVKVAGRSNLYIANGDESASDQTLYYFGEQMDDTPITTQEFYNDVPGDSHGGASGPPIERQVLGRIIRVSFNLSAWNFTTRFWLENHNGAYSVNGAVLDSEVGKPLFKFHSFRLLIVPVRDNSMLVPATTKDKDYFCFNFPNAHLSSPIEFGQGTKFSALRFTMEAHRCVGTHSKAGVIWDRDITGLGSAVTAQNAMLADQLEAVSSAKSKVNKK